MHFVGITAVLVVSIASSNSDRAEYSQCCTNADRQIVIKQWNSIWRTYEHGWVKNELGKVNIIEFSKRDADLRRRGEIFIQKYTTAGLTAMLARFVNYIDLLVNTLSNEELHHELAKHLILVIHDRQLGFVPKREQFFTLADCLIEVTLPQIMLEFDPAAFKSCFYEMMDNLSSIKP